MTTADRSKSPVCGCDTSVLHSTIPLNHSILVNSHTRLYSDHKAKLPTSHTKPWLIIINYRPLGGNHLRTIHVCPAIGQWAADQPLSTCLSYGNSETHQYIVYASACAGSLILGSFSKSCIPCKIWKTINSTLSDPLPASTMQHYRSITGRSRL